MVVFGVGCQGVLIYVSHVGNWVAQKRTLSHYHIFFQCFPNDFKGVLEDWIGKKLFKKEL